jgi:hypothetical protein
MILRETLLLAEIAEMLSICQSPFPQQFLTSNRAEGLMHCTTAKIMLGE